MDKEWIPAFAAERHSHDTNMLVGSTPRIGLTYSGGMTELRRKNGELTTSGWNEQLTPIARA